MKVSVRGNLSLDSFGVAVRQLIDRLAAGDVDHVSGIYIYLTPWSEGLRVSFVDDNGVANDELVIEAIKTRNLSNISQAAGRSFSADRISKDQPNPIVEAFSAQLRNCCLEWGLTIGEVAELMRTDDARLIRLLNMDDLAVLRRERECLDDLDRLSRILETATPDVDRPAWIKGPPTIPGFDGNTTFDQLACGGSRAFMHLEGVLLRQLQ